MLYNTKALLLHCVFHGIRFKVNEDWVSVIDTLLFFMKVAGCGLLCFLITDCTDFHGFIILNHPDGNYISASIIYKKRRVSITDTQSSLTLNLIP